MASPDKSKKTIPAKRIGSKIPEGAKKSTEQKIQKQNKNVTTTKGRVRQQDGDDGRNDDQRENEDKVVYEDDSNEDEDNNEDENEDDDDDEDESEEDDYDKDDEDDKDDDDNEDEDEDEDENKNENGKKKKENDLVNDVEHLQQQLERRHDKKWKKSKKTSQKVKLAQDYEVQRKGRKFDLVRKKEKLLQEMQDENELIFNTHKQKLLLHKRKLEKEISSMNAKKHKKSNFVGVQTKKETNLGMVLEEMVKIHKLLLEERKEERCMRKMQLKVQSECMLLFMNWMQAMLEK
jgi:hypothetical protein